ncbi:MAG: LysM peptidoglycan-binding domain-containing protein [Kiritimatiellae bacterium]|nr:LysM peptidoglycan-binding domain-containing protein [Kiritimatiellia bacterium]
MKNSAVLTGAAVAVALSIVATGCKAQKPARPTPSKPAVHVHEPAKPVPPPQQVQPGEIIDVEVTPVDIPEVKHLPPPPPPQPPKDVKAPPPPPPSAPKTVDYKIKKNETISIISRRTNIKIPAIVEANPGLDPNKVREGQVIKLPNVAALPPAPPPAPKTVVASEAKQQPAAAPAADGTTDYVIKKGDSLSVIAHKFGVKVADIKSANGLTSDNIREGRHLRIPAKGAVVQPPAPKPVPQLPVIDLPPAPPQPEIVTGDDKNKPAPIGIKGKEDPGPTPIIIDGPKPIEEPPAVDKFVHSVQEGEDIVTIAIKYHVSPGQIVSANADVLKTPADPLAAGMALKLPKEALVE